MRAKLTEPPGGILRLELEANGAARVKGGLGRVARGTGLIHFGDGAESVSPAISEAVAFISVADSIQLRGGVGSHPS